MTAPSDRPQPTRIRPAADRIWPDARELWNQRSLLRLLTLRGLVSRYRQSLLGVGWAVLYPIVTLLIFYVVFGRTLGMDEAATGPYPVFLLIGIVLWNFFATSLSSTTQSVVNNAGLIGKVYFPRLFLPLSAIGVAVVDGLIQGMLLGLLMLVFRIEVSAAWCWLPAIVVWLVLLSTAAGTGLAALNVRFRDVGHAVPFAIQTLFFLTPVGYPAALVSSEWRAFYAINPVSTIIESARYALGLAPSPPTLSLAVSGVATVIVVLTGLVYFERTARRFADTI